ncbi:hypothetical protein EDB83DRAFT_675496 [Lactarius deliciosus]|nr:hypothetical protein EDB83DRAFT_675496 [Lactarius deliciosus]
MMTVFSFGGHPNTWANQPHRRHWIGSEERCWQLRYTGSACTNNETQRNGNRVDLAPRIGYCTKRVVGGVVGVLFCLRGTLAITSLGSLPVFLLSHFVSHVPLDVWLGVYIGFTECAHFLWHWVSCTCMRKCF